MTECVGWLVEEWVNITSRNFFIYSIKYVVGIVISFVI